MDYVIRQIESKIRHHLQAGKSVLLLGPRQTGKTTLIKHISSQLSLSLISPRVRLRYEKDPSLLADEVEALLDDSSHQIPLVIIDEVQKVPVIMDVVQDLIDRKIAQFILTGSSARKLKRGNTINLLPGRVIAMHLDPFSFDEIPHNLLTLDELLIYGALPEIILTSQYSDREELLNAYVSIYLEEEIRAEAIVRNLGHFARFLELAASESGQIVNFTKLSNEIGVAHTTIASYYQILEDCLIVERIDPLTQSRTRKKLSKSHKYIFFDLGVRRIAAREGIKPPTEYIGRLFEQFIALELIRKIRTLNLRAKLHYWRDLDGPEIDWVISFENKLIPCEVKWTESPKSSDIRLLNIFLQEYPEAKTGYVICRTPRKLKLRDNIYAIPWQMVHDLI